MDVASGFFVGFTLLAAVLANISFWSPRKLWVKLTALAVTIALVPLGYASITELLSRPKPVALEWLNRSAKEAKLVGASFDEGQAIYIWIVMPETREPRAYTLPWSIKTAQQLQEAQRDAKKQRNGVRVRQPFETSRDDREPMFYAPPQRALEPKPMADGDRGLHFIQPRRGT